LQWSALAVEAEKKGISINELVRQLVDAFINGSEVLSSVTNIDLQIKHQKLQQLILKNEGEIYNNRIKKQTAIYLETFGQPPSRNGKLAIAEGNYVNDNDVKRSLTEAQWVTVFRVCTETTTDNHYFICISCGFKSEHNDSMRVHLLHNHQNEIKFALKEISSP
jgi:sporulation protein YlmC with PRC-barrel domain